jgi:hypothetical protein
MGQKEDRVSGKKREGSRICVSTAKYQAEKANEMERRKPKGKRKRSLLLVSDRVREVLRASCS